MWKTRKIGFLGVVIGPNGIEMKAEKVDRVLSWLQPKNMKDVRKFLDLANYATREVLSMKCSDEKWRPVTFISKSLSDTERNYEIHDKDMLAVVRCLEV